LRDQFNVLDAIASKLFARSGSRVAPLS